MLENKLTDNEHGGKHDHRVGSVADKMHQRIRDLDQVHIRKHQQWEVGVVAVAGQGDCDA